MRGRHRAVIQQELSDDVCDPGLARDDRRDRASLPDNRVHTLYAYPSRDDSRCHGATSDFYAIHNGCASNPGRASDHRPSSYRNHRDRQSVILLRATG